MGIAEALVLVTGIGCATGVVCLVVEKVFGARAQRSQQEQRLLQERLDLLERENRHLREQVEWQGQLLATPRDRPALAELSGGRGVG